MTPPRQPPPAYNLRMRPLLPLTFAVTACALLACRRPNPPAPQPDPDARPAAPASAPSPAVVTLPPADPSAPFPLHRALLQRKSVREFDPAPLSQPQIAQLAWAAQGLVDPTTGRRTAPSAGALYPLELYFVTPTGSYHYLPARHAMALNRSADSRAELAHAAFDQACVRNAPLVVVIASVTDRTRAKYGDRAPRYAAIEAGHVAQNLLLEAAALGLAGVPVGGFDDDPVRKAVGLGAGEDPLYVVPIGAPRAP